MLHQEPIGYEIWAARVIGAARVHDEESKRQYNKPSEVAFVLFETEIK